MDPIGLRMRGKGIMLNDAAFLVAKDTTL